jgi:molybdenum cofactor guanylyltransferase
MLALNQVSAVVLAGGRATRMGGHDKGLQLLHGKALVQHAIERLNTQLGGPVHSIAINANRNLETYQRFCGRVFTDLGNSTVPGYAGPLAGFATGLHHCATTYLLTVPCDCPFLPLDLAQRLLTALLDANTKIAIVQDQPVCALLDCSLRNHLNDYLQSGGRKVQSWIGQHRTATVAFDQEYDDPHAFANANTPEQLTALEQRGLG